MRPSDVQVKYDNGRGVPQDYAEAVSKSAAIARNEARPRRRRWRSTGCSGKQDAYQQALGVLSAGTRDWWLETLEEWAEKPEPDYEATELVWMAGMRGSPIFPQAGGGIGQPASAKMVSDCHGARESLDLAPAGQQTRPCEIGALCGWRSASPARTHRSNKFHSGPRETGRT